MGFLDHYIFDRLDVKLSKLRSSSRRFGGLFDSNNIVVLTGDQSISGSIPWGETLRYIKGSLTINSGAVLSTSGIGLYIIVEGLLTVVGAIRANGVMGNGVANGPGKNGYPSGFQIVSQVEIAQSLAGGGGAGGSQVGGGSGGPGGLNSVGRRPYGLKVSSLLIPFIYSGIDTSSLLSNAAMTKEIPGGTESIATGMSRLGQMLLLLGGGGGASGSASQGGHGGGIIYIEALGGIVVNVGGAIEAKGGAGTGITGGGGGGGLIMLVTPDYINSGGISVAGGLSGPSGYNGGDGTYAVLAV